jgi:hypothetical protein
MTMSKELHKIRQSKSFIHTLNKFFHPTFPFASNTSCNTEPEIGTTVFLPHELEELDSLRSMSSKDRCSGALCTVQGRHGRSDDGKLSNIHLEVWAQVGSLMGRFTRIIFQVLLRNPGKVQYSSPYQN